MFTKRTFAGASSPSRRRAPPIADLADEINNLTDPINDEGARLTPISGLSQQPETAIVAKRLGEVLGLAGLCISAFLSLLLGIALHHSTEDLGFASLIFLVLAWTPAAIGMACAYVLGAMDTTAPRPPRTPQQLMADRIERAILKPWFEKKK